MVMLPADDAFAAAATRHPGKVSPHYRSSVVPLNTVALELVPPNTDRSPDEILDEARKVVRISAETGIAGRSAT